MKESKKKKLESKGWKVGTTEEFLALSPEEAAFIEIKNALSKNLQTKRCKNKMTQSDLARLIKSSQSRVAKIEAGDPSVSIDLIVRSLLALGSSPKSIAKAMNANF
ncbi:MAG: helix-turn-helix transcriptional regulator [Ignavibacteria bacterium]|nr:helix-turn-helix transcriptional regulator [Ignavibacteria bacterium]